MNSNMRLFKLSLSLIWVMGLGMLVPALSVWAAEPAAVSQAALQFTDLGGVRSWRAAGDAVVFVKNTSEQWYRAEMAETCMKLDTKKGVSFLTETDPDTKEKMSKVVVDHHICRVISLTKIDPPPTIAKP